MFTKTQMTKGGLNATCEFCPTCGQIVGLRKDRLEILSEAGRKGGEAVKKKYGLGHFKQIAKLGGRPKREI